MTDFDAANESKSTESPDKSDWGFSRPLLKNPWFYYALALIALITFSRPFLRHVAEPLPVLMDIPNYEFVSEQGQVFGSKELHGRPYVASFIFTRCQTACPLIAGKLAELQQQLLDGGLPVRLVSFSVDPGYDRPSELKSFAERYGARSDVWTFLTPQDGADVESYLTFIEGAFAVAAEPIPNASVFDIAHSQKLLLVDAQGKLRGIFSASSDGISEIFHRSVSLLGEPHS